MPQLKPRLNVADMKLIFDVFTEMLDKREASLKKFLDEKLEQKLNEKLTEKIDPIMGELKAIREEQTVISFHSAEHHDRLEKLEDIHSKYQHP